MRLLCLLWLLLVNGNAVLAQQYNFRNWTLADGLPQSKVNDILQDHRMQIWVATRGGVSRFDGNTFHTYTRQQGLASNNTSCLFQDSRQHIWIGSTDNGLTRFDGAKFTTYGIKAGLPGGNISSITEDKVGKLWVATDSGIFMLTGSRFIRSPEFEKQPYQVIYCDTKGDLWAGSKSNGIYRLEQDSLYHFSNPQYKLPSNTITAIFNEPGTSNVWIGTTEGPAVFTNDHITVPSLPATVKNPAVSDFEKNINGNIMVGLQHDGIVSLHDRETKHLTKANGLSSLHTTSLLADKENNLWIGTDGYGLQQKRSQWFLHFFELGTIKDPHITALAQDTKGRVWFGTDNGDAAYMQNGQLTMLQAKEWPPGTVLYSMWVRSEEDVWVSTSKGVWNLTPDKAQHYTTAQGLPSEKVYFIVADKDKKLWFATANGIAYLQNGRFVPITTAAGEQAGETYHLYHDKQNRIWAGTKNGIYLIENNQLRPVKPLKNQSFGEVVSIAEDSNGWLYFGGYNYGLLAYHSKSGKAKLFTSTNGLPNEGIKTIYSDRNNNLWVGTNSNVLKIDLPYFHQEQKLRYRTYGGNNGFRGFEVSNNGITQTPDGTIWFGTEKGLTQYIPELDRINKATPELMLTDIKLFMRQTDWQQQGFETDASGLPINLRLPYSKNHITFNYHGICLSAPSEVKYKYMLTGHDQQWSETSDQTFATYANLQPGVYTFKLKAQNNDGYWTAKPLSYTFSVVPPVWRREWFIGLLLLVITGAIITVIRLREQSLLKMNTLLDMRVKHRTRMLERKHREKELLLQEVHHRVKNNLQIVISLLNLQARHVKDPEAIEVMQAIRSRVRSMALLHERLYRHDNLEHIDLENYFREICESLYAAYGVSEEKVALLLDIPPTNIDLDSAITLGLIVNELVSNTLKYAFPDSGAGSLGIELQHLESNRYQLTVWDNGIGSFKEPDQQQSFGLQLVSSLSKKLDGKIINDNNNGTKTILFFVLPS
ncbi:hypothetical protein JAO76_03565 [Pontibacter sp. BT310]|uniref:histidine kinase n=1 Tax=Pontibacter populi TaxID=890055 RepID=A0ABS6X7Y8_9BACT|nr:MULTISPECIES: two-component regulator propeller domain-containing protein [Pontibacter]MBJ6117252.1 hypothetical protein [Pontibacter sp. BT310]MBR0569677.1 hypothetical protein [Microvirga sp. STS03]MBW3364105.1 hypothetical protein [Pontibacter populi]